MIAFFYMINKILNFGFFFLFLQTIVGQDSLLVGKTYFEDQLYIGVTSNMLRSKPEPLQQTGLSTGLQLGFIKDIPFSQKGNFGLGIGVGYSINKYKQNLVLPDFSLLDLLNTESNSYSVQAVEFPFTFRFRTSTEAIKPFFRLYVGTKLSYVFASSSNYINDRSAPIPFLNKWQYGPQISVGYGNINVYAYYGQTEIFQAVTETEDISIDNLKEFKIGLQFFIF